MVRTHFIALFITNIVLSYSQNSKEIDFVLTIDDKVVIAAQGLKLVSPTGSLTISPNYHPGNLSIPRNKYEGLTTTDYESLNLVFSYTKEFKGKTKDYFYEIPFSTNWLKEKFMVLNIYNFDKRKNKKKYMPATQGSSYAFTVDFGWYSILNLR